VDDFPDPEWTCPNCGGRVETPWCDYDFANDLVRCFRKDCGHQWKPRTVEISLRQAIDVLTAHL
jgi:hypothetical protein